ncbi:MAG: hypothetical protein WD016_00640 [Balneolaceae bacterium]
MAERIKVVSDEDLNPYIGMDFEKEKILVNPFMEVDIREYFQGISQINK